MRDTYMFAAKKWGAFAWILIVGSRDMPRF